MYVRQEWMCSPNLFNTFSEAAPRKDTQNLTF